MFIKFAARVLVLLCVAGLAGNAFPETCSSPPVAQDDPVLWPDEVRRIEVRSNDYDPNGLAITVISVSPLTGGTPSVTSDGQAVLFTPTVGAKYGSFHYTIRNSDGQTANATVTLSDSPPQQTQTVDFAESCNTNRWCSFKSIPVRTDSIRAYGWRFFTSAGAEVPSCRNDDWRGQSYLCLFPGAGTYRVQHTVYYHDGSTDTNGTGRSVSVQDVFTTNWTATPEGLTVRAHIIESTDTHSTAELRMQWGDGSEPNGFPSNSGMGYDDTATQHTYLNAGNYRVSMQRKIANTTTWTTVGGYDVDVSNAPPTLTIDAQSVPAGAGSEEVTLDYNIFDEFTPLIYDWPNLVPNPHGPTKYEWDFGDGTTLVMPPPQNTPFRISHTYPSGRGTYVTRLKVTDYHGATGEGTVTVNVTNSRPVAKLFVQCEGQHCRLDGSQSSDDTGIAEYKFEVTRPLGALATPVIINSSPAYSAEWAVSKVLDGNLNTDYASAGHGVNTFIDFDFGAAPKITEVTYTDRRSSGGANGAGTMGGGDNVSQFNLIFSADTTFGSPDDTVVPVTSASCCDTIVIPINGGAGITARYVRYDVTNISGNVNSGAAEFSFKTDAFSIVSRGASSSATVTVPDSNGAWRARLIVTDDTGLSADATTGVAERYFATRETLPGTVFYAVEPCTLGTATLTMDQWGGVHGKGKCGIPDDPNVLAAAVNVRLSNTLYPGSLRLEQAYATGILNVDPARSQQSNFAIIPFNATGDLQMILKQFPPAGVTATGTITLDTVGYFRKSTGTLPVFDDALGTIGPLWYRPVKPCVLYDTRNEAPGIASGSPRLFDLRDRCGLTGQEAALALQATVIVPSANGTFVAHSASTPAPATAISGHAIAGRSLASSLITKVSNGMMNVRASAGSGNLTLSTPGVFTRDRGQRFFATQPCRILDTRLPTSGKKRLTSGVVLPSQQLSMSFQVRGNCGISRTASAALLQVVVFTPDGNGHVQLYATGTDRSNYAAVNYTTSQNSPDHAPAIVPLGNAEEDVTVLMNAFNGSGADIIVDSYGYFDERDNLAAASNGGSAYGSSTLGAGYPASSMVDGDRRGTGWGNGTGGWHDATGSTFPDFVEVHFDGEKLIDEVDLFTLQDTFNAPAEPAPSTPFTLYGVQEFDVGYFDSATNQWTYVANVKTQNKVWSRVLLPRPVRTRKLSIVIRGGAGNYSRITEIEAWGKPMPAEQ